MDPIIGIDLGTTNSAVAWLADDGPKLIPNALGTTLTPSVVGIDPDGNLVVGAAAKELQVLQPDRCTALFKRPFFIAPDLLIPADTRTASRISSTCCQ